MGDDRDDDRIVQKQSQNFSTSHSTKVECDTIDRTVTVTYRSTGVHVICRHNHGGFCDVDKEDCYIVRSHERGPEADRRAAVARATAEMQAIASCDDDDDYDDDDYDDDGYDDDYNE